LKRLLIGYMNKAVNIFYNTSEKRLRSGWRLIIQFGLFLGAYLLPIVFLDGIRDSYYKNLADEISTFLLVIFSIWIVTKFIDKRKFSDLGFHFNADWFFNYFEGLIIGAVVFFFIFLIELSFNWIEVYSYASLENIMGFILKLAGRLFGFFCVAVMEETFSRGYQLKNLSEGFFSNVASKRKAIIIALIVSSVFFGIMHAENPNITLLGVFNLSLIGLFYGYAYIATGSLAMAIGIHTTWNFVQGNILGYQVSGMDSEISVFQINNIGPASITGGSFGPEGGIIIIAAILFGAVILNFTISGNPFKFSIREKIAEY